MNFSLKVLMDPLFKKSLYSENFRTSTDTECNTMTPSVAITGFSMMASLFLPLPHPWLGGCVDTTQSGRYVHAGLRCGSHQCRDSRSCGSDWTPSGRKWAEGGNNIGTHRDCYPYDMWRWHSQTYLKLGDLNCLLKEAFFKLLGGVSIYWANNTFSFILATHIFFGRWPEKTMLLFNLSFKYADVSLGWLASTFNRTLG